MTKKLLNEQPQSMEYNERERLKSFAYNTKDIDELKEMIIIIAHWLRQRKPVAFSKYYEFAKGNEYSDYFDWE